MYANRVGKINRFGWEQQRAIAITDKAIYNINGTQIKRTIKIEDCIGMTKTVPPSKCTREFTVHVGGSYDYRYQTDL